MHRLSIRVPVSAVQTRAEQKKRKARYVRTVYSVQYTVQCALELALSAVLPL